MLEIEVEEVRSYQIISDESIEPATKLVLLLDDVVRDGSTTGILGLSPAESD